MRTKGIKRTAAIVLSLIMALAYMPCVAFAAGGDDGQTDTGVKGREFINKMIDDHNGYNLDEMIAACKVSTYPVSSGSGGTISTVADIANSENFEKIINQACTYDNLKKGIAYMRECNAHRELPIHNAGTLKVSYQLMGTAIVSAALNENVTAHMLMHVDGEDKWTFWQSGNSMACSENLAFSSASKEQGWDPFHGWYYQERMKALANGGNPDQSIVSAVLNESVENGYKYDPYGAPWGNSEEGFLNRVAGVSTGHYTNMINPIYKATGFCYVDAPQYALSYFPYVASQEFNSDTSESVTVDQYEQELNAWFKTGEESGDTPGGDTPGGTNDPLPPAKISIAGAKVTLSAASFTYNAKVRKPTIKSVGGKSLKAGTDYTLTIKNSKGTAVTSPKVVGTYTMYIAGKGKYTGTAKATYKITKAKNTLVVKPKTATVKYSVVKKKNQTLKCTAVLNVTGNKGTLTYVKSSGNKKIVIAKKTGKVTVKKGLKKGKYTVKVKVTAAGNSNYNKITKTVKFTVKVVK